MKETVWPRAKDKETFRSLVDSIRAKKCAAFIGSGLSQNSNYPDWEGLILALSQHVEEITGRRVERGEDNYEWAERCKGELTSDQYAQFFVSQFGEDAGRLSTNPAYEDLDEVPFTAIVTTNYDTCLIHATRRTGNLRGVHRFPHLDAGYLHTPELGHIYHIHGVIHPDNPDVCARSVVFTQSEYADAYQGRSDLAGFLDQLVKNHDLLFIGFGLRDTYLMDQVRRIWESRRAQSHELAGIGVRLEDRTHYAFLPVLGSGAAEALITGSQASPVEAQEDAWFEQYGIRVMRYDPVNDLRVGLARVIEEIREKTSTKKLSSVPKISDLEVVAEIEV